MKIADSEYSEEHQYLLNYVRAEAFEIYIHNYPHSFVLYSEIPDILG
jgi:hypothetical protein